jgi:hypothetical protein
MRFPGGVAVVSCRVADQRRSARLPSSGDRPGHRIEVGRPHKVGTARRDLRTLAAGGESCKPRIGLRNLQGETPTAIQVCQSECPWPQRT